MEIRTNEGAKTVDCEEVINFQQMCVQPPPLHFYAVHTSAVTYLSSRSTWFHIGVEVEIEEKQEDGHPIEYEGPINPQRVITAY